MNNVNKGNQVSPISISHSTTIAGETGHNMNKILRSAAHSSLRPNIEYPPDLAMPAIRVKIGFDPTSESLHLGHYTLLRRARQIQDDGNAIIIIIGDYTAMIGDPSNKLKSSEKIESENIVKNSKTYIEQITKFLNPHPAKAVEIYYNSMWLKKIKLSEFIQMASMSSINEVLGENNYLYDRLKNNDPISMKDTIYSLLQGHDSIKTKTDLELGGGDQIYNMKIGQRMQYKFKQKNTYWESVQLLPCITGESKMSKNMNNAIYLNEDAISIYSKLQKTNDNVVDTYIKLLTNLDISTIPKDPRQKQKIMALEVISNLFDKETAHKVQETVSSIVLNTGDKNDKEVPTVELKSVWDWSSPIPAYVLVQKIFSTKSAGESRRSIQGGAFKIDGEKINDPKALFQENNLTEKIVQLGKKRFYKLV